MLGEDEAVELLGFAYVAGVHWTKGLSLTCAQESETLSRVNLLVRNPEFDLQSDFKDFFKK